MIHYHGTPSGGKRTDTLAFVRGRHVFVPFPRPDDLPAALEVASSFAVDNGAYSVWKQGGALDVEAYFAFVESVRRAPNFDFAIMPDAIEGSAEDNAKLIARWPFNACEGVPVWHLHEPLDWLLHLAVSYPRVALGSSGQWATPGVPEWWRRMTEAMHTVCDGGRPRCKLHGLRMLSTDIFTRLPLASADSTNAVRNGSLTTRFGMYPPMHLSARQCAIADRIEAHQSPPVWAGLPQARDGLLFEWGAAEEAKAGALLP